MAALDFWTHIATTTDSSTVVHLVSDARCNICRLCIVTNTNHDHAWLQSTRQETTHEHKEEQDVLLYCCACSMLAVCLEDGYYVSRKVPVGF